MMSSRNPQVQALYDRFKLTYRGDCAFCDIRQRNPSQIIKDHGSMMVIKNEYPYSLWDGFDVGDHLMIIPVRHLGNFAAFTEQERDDFFELLREYESAHYSVYSRAPSSKVRTVGHLHTHLIKPVGY